ncbi:MAG: hypothetical protein QW229_07380, partial [Desulfurococcaceae archaeon]
LRCRVTVVNATACFSPSCIPPGFIDSYTGNSPHHLEDRLVHMVVSHLLRGRKRLGASSALECRLW